MRALAFAVALVLAAACSNSACTGGGNPPCCSSTAEVNRDVTYLGSIPAADGGTPTQVKLRVSTGGNARLTFTRGGTEIAESFSAQ